MKEQNKVLNQDETICTAINTLQNVMRTLIIPLNFYLHAVFAVVAWSQVALGNFAPPRTQWASAIWI